MMHLAEHYEIGKVVVIGSEFIGIEAAENLKERGIEVT